MQDPRIDALANILVNYSARVQPGQLIAIYAPVAAAPLIKALHHHILKAGAMPYAFPDFPELGERFLRDASDEQLQHKPVVLDWLVDNFDSILYIGAPENTRGMSGIDPARMAMYRSAQRELNVRRVARLTADPPKDLISMFPTAALAQEAEMSLDDYEEFFFQACRVNEADPVAAWRKQAERQAVLVAYLDGKEQMHIQSPECDLRLGIAGRRFINADGKVNFPDGEIFTSPVENATNGHVRFTYPAVYQGREVNDVELVFEEGRVVKATAGKDQAYLDQMLGMDEGAKRLGEIAIGTNPGITRFTKNTLLDEKISGTVHMALGQSFPNIGGLNTSALHWDMVTSMREGTITVDDVVIYKNGEFVI